MSDRTVRLTTAQALVTYLQAQESERDGETRRLIPGMLGIFGHGNVHGIGQALDEVGGGMPFHQGHNEQSMVHSAIAFAKATRRRAALAVTSSIGPGATNMVTGAASATINRLPVLLLPGDTYATRRQGPVLQQLETSPGGDVTVNDCFRPVARFFDRIVRPEQLLTALPEAMRVLTSPVETGAVVIALPQDVQSHAHDYPARFFEPRTWRIERPLPDPARIAEAVQLLRAARRPLVIAGGGVVYSEAGAELAAFAGGAGIPVVETFAGKGSVAEDAWWLLGGLGAEGNPGANAIARDADVVVCIGTRLTDFATGSHSLFRDPDVRFIAVNVDARDAHKLGAVPLVADAREALSALAAAGVRAPAEVRAEVESARAAWLGQRSGLAEQVEGEHMSQAQLILTLNEAVRPGDVVTTAAGTPPGDLLKLWDATGGRECHLEFGFSCMGYELPAAVGLRLARPDGEVIAYIGDGTYVLNPGELVTALQHGLKITVVISENHGFQSIRRLQMGRVGRPFGNEFRGRDADGGPEGELVELDLARSAEGLGARAWRASNPAELRAALAEARAETARPCVIVCETEPHRYLPDGGVWWDVAPAEVSALREVQKRRAEYERDREALQRFYY